MRQRGYDFVEADNLLITCPFHDDNNPSLSVHSGSGVFKCWACEETGDFAKLIAEIDGISISDARDFLDSGFSPSDSLKEIESLVSPKRDRVRFVDEDYFESYFPKVEGVFRKYLHGRKLTDKTIDRFGIRCCYEGKFRNRVIIPIRDYEGRMVSFNARSIFKGTVPKTKKLKSSKIINTTLFGWHERRRTDELVLVEGEIDCIFLQQFGIPAVSLMGKTLTDSRLEMILDNASHVYLSYDNDLEGQKAMRNHSSILNGHMPASPIRLPKGSDPNDLSVSQVFEYYGGLIPNEVKSKIRR